MKRIALSFAAVAFLAGSITAAQTAGIIDARDEQTTSPSVRVVGGTGVGDAVASKSLQLELSLADVHPQIGEPFAYELLVKNRSDKSVMIPQSLRWSDVVDEAGKELRYQQVAVSFAVMTGDGSTLPFDGHLSLYGSADKPETMLALAPGEVVRILGTARFEPMVEAATSAKAAKLQAYLAVNAIRLHLANSTEGGVGFRDDERHLYWAQSNNTVDIEFLATDPR